MKWEEYLNSFRQNITFVNMCRPNLKWMNEMSECNKLKIFANFFEFDEGQGEQCSTSEKKWKISKLHVINNFKKSVRLKICWHKVILQSCNIAEALICIVFASFELFKGSSKYKINQKPLVTIPCQTSFLKLKKKQRKW